MLLFKSYVIMAYIAVMKCQYQFESFAGMFTLHTNELDADGSSGIDSEINGAGICSMRAGCKILAGKKACYGPSGTNICSKCQYYDQSVNARNVMRSDFYEIFNDDDGSQIETLEDCTLDNVNCPPIPYLKDMVENMLLKGDDIAQTPQGAVYKDHRTNSVFGYHPIRNLKFSLDPLLTLSAHYDKEFCDDDCFKTLRMSCLLTTLLPHVRQWCLTSWKWIKDDINNLKGPPSYILFLAARLTDANKRRVSIPSTQQIRCDGNDCIWPDGNHDAEMEERAALVAAAFSTVLIAGNWFDNVPEFTEAQKSGLKDFGFAVHHSLWLAIFAGRLRITLNPLEKQYRDFDGIVPGTETLCSTDDVKIADNYEGVSGTIYATLCTTFRQNYQNRRKTHLLRYVPQIHTPNNLGCVERKTGMVFIRPGDWIKPYAERFVLGSRATPTGILFKDRISGLTMMELTRGRTILYPPSIAVALYGVKKTICTDAVGNGPTFDGAIQKAGLDDLGGMCNWLPVW